MSSLAMAKASGTAISVVVMVARTPIMSVLATLAR
jgi:hypothetical protein